MSSTWHDQQKELHSKAGARSFHQKQVSGSEGNITTGTQTVEHGNVSQLEGHGNVSQSEVITFFSNREGVSADTRRVSFAEGLQTDVFRTEAQVRAKTKQKQREKVLSEEGGQQAVKESRKKKPQRQ